MCRRPNRPWSTFKFVFHAHFHDILPASESSFCSHYQKFSDAPALAAITILIRSRLTQNQELVSRREPDHARYVARGHGVPDSQLRLRQASASFGTKPKTSRTEHSVKSNERLLHRKGRKVACKESETFIRRSASVLPLENLCLLIPLSKSSISPSPGYITRLSREVANPGTSSATLTPSRPSRGPSQDGPAD